MSIEQMEELSTMIEPLGGDRLERVMPIGYEGMRDLHNDDRILTLSPEQKKELSTAIQSLDGDKLGMAIQIIYEGTPDLQNSNKKIELDIEELSPSVLSKLWNFIVEPQQAKNVAVHDKDRILTLSFEQKKELSAAIVSLDGDGLAKVIQIIYDAMPALKTSNEEVEIEIDELDPAVLTKLWNSVVKPQQAKKAPVHDTGPESTSGNVSKGAAATGGVEHKIVDESVESARIRKLQEQLEFFELNDPNGAAEPPSRRS